MRVRDEHVKAAGGTAPCRSTPPPSTPTTGGGGASVRIVDETKSGWIGIELVDTEGHPVSGADFEVVLPDGHYLTGKLDGLGKVRIEGIDPGQCTVVFPKIDRRDFS